MGIYGILITITVAAIVFTLAAILFSAELGVKAAQLALVGFGVLPVVVTIAAIFCLSLFGMSCAIFDWCPFVVGH
jgi:hypothetical protein